MTPKDMACIQEKLSLQNRVESRVICGITNLRDKGISGYANEAGVLEQLY